jgi:hypothetical protein
MFDFPFKRMPIKKLAKKFKTLLSRHHYKNSAEEADYSNCFDVALCAGLSARIIILPSSEKDFPIRLYVPFLCFETKQPLRFIHAAGAAIEADYASTGTEFGFADEEGSAVHVRLNALHQKSEGIGTIVDKHLTATELKEKEFFIEGETLHDSLDIYTKMLIMVLIEDIIELLATGVNETQSLYSLMLMPKLKESYLQFVAQNQHRTVKELEHMKVVVPDWSKSFKPPSDRAVKQGIKTIENLIKLSDAQDLVHTSIEIRPIRPYRMSGPPATKLVRMDETANAFILRCKPDSNAGAIEFKINFDKITKVKDVWNLLNTFLDQTQEEEMEEGQEEHAATGATLEDLKAAKMIVAKYHSMTEKKKTLEHDLEMIAADFSEKKENYDEELSEYEDAIAALKSKFDRIKRKHDHAVSQKEKERLEIESTLAKSEEYQEAMELIEQVQALLS